MGIKALLSGEGSYSRSELLEKAARYRSKRRPKKAITAYRRILAEDPSDHEVHARMAPLLATTGEPGAAIASFRSAAEGFAARGFCDKALGAYRQAVEHVPHDEIAWTRMADLYVEKERPRDAVAVLLEGRRGYRRPYDRPRAIRLLQKARTLDPGHVEAGVDLAGLLKKAQDKAAARALLDELLAGSEGKARRRIRRAQLRLFPSPASFWRWLARR